VLKEYHQQLVPVAVHRGGNNHNLPYSRGSNFGTLFSEILKCINGQLYAPSECMRACVCVRAYVCVHV